MRTKPHLEFQSIDMTSGWETPPGYKKGFWQKILASDIDEEKKTGSRTRLLRIDPGTYSEAPFLHDHWEEIFVVQGDVYVNTDAHGQGGEKFEAPTYACRPPGALHGPVKSENGCVVFEIHYYMPE